MKFLRLSFTSLCVRSGQSNAIWQLNDRPGCMYAAASLQLLRATASREGLSAFSATAPGVAALPCATNYWLGLDFVFGGPDNFEVLDALPNRQANGMAAESFDPQNNRREDLTNAGGCSPVGLGF